MVRPCTFILAPRMSQLTSIIGNNCFYLLCIAVSTKVFRRHLEPSHLHLLVLSFVQYEQLPLEQLDMLITLGESDKALKYLLYKYAMGISLQRFRTGEWEIPSPIICEAPQSPNLLMHKHPTLYSCHVIMCMAALHVDGYLLSHHASAPPTS